MKTVGIFYGSTGGRTKEIVDVVAEKLGDVQLFDVADGVSDISSFDNIILASPTYGLGDLQDDWAGIIDEVAGMDFSGKVVALIGVGDAAIFAANFVESMKHLYDAVTPNGAKVVGFVDTDGYDFEASEAIIDGQFMGLAIDSSYDDDEVSEKAEYWVEKIKAEFV